MHRIVLKGTEAEVRWSYRRAAQVREWVLTSEPSGTTVTAAVGNCDAYAMTQTPLEFVVPRERGQPWRWPILSLAFTGDSFSAQLGTQG